MNRVHPVLVIALLIACVFTPLTQPQTTAAAYGNVQLRIETMDTTAKFTFVKIQGFNQDSKSVTWERSFSPATSAASTNGWWWNGSRKTITVHFDNGVRLSCGVFHNTHPWSNWETVRINPNGSVNASGPGNSCTKI